MTVDIRAYFFDLDGTLVETAPEIADAVNDTLRYFDWPRVSQQQVNDWIGHGTKELLIQRQMLFLFLFVVKQDVFHLEVNQFMTDFVIL